ncbi:MAG TPA: outer membrane beta-barrel protein [Xanthobacteraceae bacterium]|nr:outer membrane beta-barrel protein [Xanthobacteraceae bacterium]
MPRRRQTPPSLGLRAGVLLAALALEAPSASAQMAATTDFPLLAPTLDGNPRTPPVFRKADTQTPPATTTTAVGQLPNFDDQPSIGAGSTGFNSSNTKPKAPSGIQPSGAGANPPGATGTKTTAAASAQVSLPPVLQTSAVGSARLQQNQNQTRHGAPAADATAGAGANASALAPAPASTTPDPTLAVPRTLIRRPVVDDKPFDPVGIAAGSFRLRPAIEVSGGYDTNPARTNMGGGASNFGIVAPELLVNSNWSRHELTANLRGSYTAYGAASSLDRPAFDGKVDGRIDVTSRTRIDLESRLVVATDNPGSPNIQAGLARLPISTDVGGSIGLGQRFNRFDVALKGGIDRTTYQNSVFTDGTSASNDGRNFDQYSAQLRTGYELTPGVIPFVELDADRRHHDLAVDSSGFDRNSQGRAAKVGSTFELSRILIGQLAFGYLERDYTDPTLQTVKGPTFDGSLTWVASALTTFKLTAVTSANESTLAGVSGVFTHEVGIEVDHAFRTWLDATLKFTGDRDTYVGQSRQDGRFAGSFALTYKLTREMQLKGELRREWLTSNMAGNNYQAYVALLGVRLQR